MPKTDAQIMKWNVFYHNFNAKRIEPFDIFTHGRFRVDVFDDLKCSGTKDELADKLKHTLMYYFWCKSEYEILISPWCGSKTEKPVKIDIYDQVMINWDMFVDYVWSHK